MKHPVSIACLLFCITAGKAQSLLADLPAVNINLKNTDDLPYHPGVFSHFEVIDERADTARIGIHNFDPIFAHSRNRQLVFRHPAGMTIAEYLNTRFARPGAPYSALIILRNLWLSDANFIKEDKVKNPNIMEQRTHIRLKAEIYAFKDSFYIPLIRYDTIQTYKRGNTYNNLTTYYALWDKDLSAVLSDMADSAAGLAPVKAEHSRHLQREDILQFNRSRFDATITGTASRTPGVYTSFEEFRNNAPSILHFEIQREKKDQLLYIQDANGSFYYSHDAWGYCDGRSVFIMRDGKLYQLWKEGNAFYFFGQAYKEFNMEVPDNRLPQPATKGPAGIVSPGKPGHTDPNPPTTTTHANLHRIYTVDMDSGAVY
ncbi:MAG TPA: hypothetical protein VHW43_09925 [Puia sp.]|nr:hypothetical protein [Puia sp.]